MNFLRDLALLYRGLFDIIREEVSCTAWGIGCLWSIKIYGISDNWNKDHGCNY